MELLRRFVCLDLIHQIIEYVYDTKNVHTSHDFFVLEHVLKLNKPTYPGSKYSSTPARPFICQRFAELGLVQELKWMHEKKYISSDDYFTIITFAAYFGHLNILEWMKEMCCSESIDFNQYAYLIVEKATSSNHLEILEWICDNGDAVCSNTILFTACNLCNCETARFLLNAVKCGKMKWIGPGFDVPIIKYS